MHRPLYPLLYQINTRVWLTELSRALGREATLDDIPDRELDQLAEMGFDWVWFLSVWQTGLTGQNISRTNAGWREDFKETLPDLREEDIGGSGFAIADYTVREQFGGDAALRRLRERLYKRGLRLMLDFVPNHTALDHSWVDLHPEYYVLGTAAEMEREPRNYTRIQRDRGELIVAHGRDPYFPGWPDTLQLNYGNPATQEALNSELAKIANRCDGVRCDMAMLVLPEVFERTWGISCQPFWPQAVGRVRERSPEFCFMAEVYWDLEWTLQQLGFDFTYDKRLYDRLCAGQPQPVREHLCAGLDYQNKLTRFLENHDEPRAAVTFRSGMHQAAAVISYLSPGLRFFHQGQFQGLTKRISPHLVRAPQEPVILELEEFYRQLLRILRQSAVRDGRWQLLECTPAWDGNWTWDCFVASAWEDSDGCRLLMTVNYASHQSQCYVRLPFVDLFGAKWRLQDQVTQIVYDRDGNDLQTHGLYVDSPAWGTSIFILIKES